jgi:hypothetical protein
MLNFVSRKILLIGPPPKILANKCHVPNNLESLYIIIFINAIIINKLDT